MATKPELTCNLSTKSGRGLKGSQLAKALTVAAGVALVGTAEQASAASIDGIEVPDVLRFSEEAPLRLSGCGLREVMWVDLYFVAFYLEQPLRLHRQIRSRDVAKAVRVDIVFDGRIPEQMPEEWRSRLVDVLSRDLVRDLQNLFAELVTEDSLTVSYVPDAGESRVRFNGDVVQSYAGPELIDGLLALWIGPDPVSRNLRRLLLAGECAS